VTRHGVTQREARGSPLGSHVTLVLPPKAFHSIKSNKTRSLSDAQVAEHVNSAVDASKFSHVGLISKI
jgi:hypothetical protein